MKTILFATSNVRKLFEARAACEKFDIKVEQIKLNIDEIQSKNPQEISQKKAEATFLITQKPVVVTDTFWSLPALNGFPGGYMKEVAQWFLPEDFLNLMKNKKDKKIIFTESITYKDATQLKIFSKEFAGIIADKPKGSGNSIEQVAEFNGFTLGESQNLGQTSHKPEDYIWFDFAKWFSKQ